MVLYLQRLVFRYYINLFLKFYFWRPSLLQKWTTSSVWLTNQCFTVCESCINICDWIWENMHSSRIHFYFGDLWNFKTNNSETFRNCGTTIVLSLLKVSNLYAILYGCYGSPKVKIRCVNYTYFPKSSHILASLLFRYSVNDKQFHTVRPLKANYLWARLLIVSCEYGAQDTTLTTITRSHSLKSLKYIK